MQTVKRTPYELDDIALLNLLVPLPERESQPLQPVSIAQIIKTDDDPAHLTEEEADEIFHQAEQEIQPLLRKMRRDRFFEIAEMVFCFCWILGAYAGIIYQCITFPHTLVVLYAKEKPASITATLVISTRTLAPVTITRSATIPTTGHGHQDARAASGSLTFYNGLFSPQYIPVGTVFTGSDGVKVSTDASVTIPAANPPQFAEAAIPAHTLETGAVGNIHAGDINTTIANGVLVKNSQFTGGKDARDYQAVAKSDLSSLTGTVAQTVTQAFTTAFIVRQGEAAIPTTCHTTATPTHQAGEEARSITLTIVKTCSAVAYNSKELDHQATAAFTQTKPAATYHIVGSVQTTLKSVSPLLVTISGEWAYTFSPDYEQYLAEKIAGDSPDQARKTLLRIGVIAYASIPSKLPPAEYIDFFVLVGK